MDFTDRVKLIRGKTGLSRKAFGELLGVSEGKIQKIEIGKQRADHEFLAVLSRSVNVDLNWLVSNQSLAPIANEADKIPEKFISIPKLTVSASAGNGAINNSEDMTEYYAFSRKWIKRRNLSAQYLAVIMVTGDSMEPKLRDRDLILIDTSEQPVTDGKSYVVRIGDELVVKNIQYTDKDKINLISANQLYPPREIDLPKEGDNIRIIGSVVASMHEW